MKPRCCKTDAGEAQGEEIGGLEASSNSVPTDPNSRLRCARLETGLMQTGLFGDGVACLEELSEGLMRERRCVFLAPFFSPLSFCISGGFVPHSVLLAP